MNTPSSRKPHTEITGDNAAHGRYVSAALRTAERYRVAAITTRRFTPETYWRVVAPLVAKPGFRTEEIGRSLNGRPIRAVTFGEGKTTVLLWSQMHGDEATATMRQEGDGGAMTGAVLRPVVTISAGDPAAAAEAHHRAHELCFIANSVSFPVRVEPTIRVA